MATFRICLGLGLGTVLVLGLAGLYPVALIAAAVLRPVLVVVYMFDVNVFEDLPLPVWARPRLGHRRRGGHGADREGRLADRHATCSSAATAAWC